MSQQSQIKNSWLKRQEVTDQLEGQLVLVRSNAGKVSKGQILRVRHDREGCKHVTYSINGRQRTARYDLGESVTHFALR